MNRSLDRICWWSVEVISRGLDSDERDAVLGDLADCRDNAWRALQGVVGLVFRRQIGAWRHWSPWIALGGIVVPLGLLLSIVSKRWADTAAIDIFVYINNWNPAHLQAGFYRSLLISDVADFVMRCFAIACWSWTSGFVLGALARRTAWVNGFLFCAVLFVGTLGTSTSAPNIHNAAVFSVTLYSLFPMLLRIALVAFPAALGARRARSSGDSLSPGRVVLWTAAIAGMTVAVTRSLQTALIFGQGRFSLLNPGLDGITGNADDRFAWQLWLLPLVIAWPTVFILVTTIWKQRHERMVRNSS